MKEKMPKFNRSKSSDESRARAAELRDIAADAQRGGAVNALLTAKAAAVARAAAAELARSLDRELMVVNLEAIASRYIGETEKNLSKLFEEASRSNAVLFFDEADALFGKRTEVKDSHDRYANIEVSYLLQAIEQYAGVVVLHNSGKSALDPAFVRRLRHVIDLD